MTDTIYNKSCLDMSELDDNSIDCCVTSPPYWGLRNYNHDDQIGLEQTPEMYVEKMVQVFTEVKRVLKPEGTLWLNIGDTYSAHKDCKSVPDSLRVGGNSETANDISKGMSCSRNSKMLKEIGLKNKDLIGIPWLVAFALRSSGWYLRQDIIWAKPNPMPESVRDRCTKSHEYIFLMSKSQKYYYDYEAIMEDTITQDNSNRDRDNQKLNNTPGRTMMGGLKTNNYEKRNKRSVWTVTTKPFKEAHFATFPEDLIAPCILAGCPKGGVVLDPFMGAGTTAVVALRAGRKYVGYELNPKYIKIAENRIASYNHSERLDL